MSVLARIFLIIYSLLLGAAAIGLAILAWNQDQMLDLNAGDFTLRAFIDSGDTEKWILTLIAALVVLIALISLVIALRPWRAGARGRGRGEEPVTLQQAGGGTIEVTPRAVELMLVDELLDIEGVRQADAEVRMDKKAVDTRVTLGVDPGVNFAEVSREANAVVTGALRGRLGVTNVNPPSVRIEHTETATTPAAAPRAQYTSASRPAYRDEPAESYDEDENGNGDTSAAEPAPPSPEPLPPPPPPRVTGVHGGVVSFDAGQTTPPNQAPPPPAPGPATRTQWKPNAPAESDSDSGRAVDDTPRRESDSLSWDPAPPSDRPASQPDDRRDEGHA